MSQYQNKIKEAEQFVKRSQKEKAASLLNELSKIDLQEHDELNRVGLIAYNLGYYDAAIHYFTHALQRSPQNSAYYNHLGLAHMKKGASQQAENYFEKALQLSPTNHLAYHNLGVLYENLFQYDKAEKMFQKEMRVNPYSALAHYGMALVAERRSQNDKAYEHAKKALELNPQNVGSLNILSQIEMRRKNFKQALESSEKATQLDPYNPHGWYYLGHVFHALKDYEKAFASFTKANELQDRKLITKEKYDQEMKSILTFLKKLEKTNLTQKIEINSTYPIFIVGSPRSGTTLLAQMLGMHSKLQNEGELEILSQIYQEANYRLREPNDIGKILESIWHPANVELAKILHRKFLEIWQSFPSSQNGLWGIDKLPSNGLRMGLIARITPGAPVIHIIRDGREVAFSAFTQDFRNDVWHSHSLENAIFEWQWMIQISRESARVLKLPYYEIRYEDLVQHPKNTLKRVLTFLQLNWEENCLHFDQSQTLSHTASYNQVRQKLYTSSLHKAKAYQKQYEMMTELAKEALEELGYL